MTGPGAERRVSRTLGGAAEGSVKDNELATRPINATTDAMLDGSDADGFLASVPILATFPEVAETAAYSPVPADWVLGCADVVASGEAIRTGRYKTVNAAGAAVIAAVKNEIGHRDFPFVFGGDGASFALPASLAAPATKALAATATFVREELALDLRVGLIPVSDIREAGLDVRLARYAASSHVHYAMFSGGGLAFADEQLKAGHYAIAPAPAGTRPNLDGLSCSFAPIPAREGVILSLIVRPADGADPGRYRTVIDDIVRLAEGGTESTSPLPSEGPRFLRPLSGLGLQTRIARGTGSGLLTRLRLLLYTTFSWLVFTFRIRVGGFDPTLYLSDLVANSDYRKYDDGLRMTIDSSPDRAKRIEERLVEADREGVVRFGLHRQNEALMTCITVSPMRRDHVHFIDGAAGGYAAAAAQMKGARP
jgi:hypothetical protein